MPSRDLLPAGDPFPALSELLAERYDYLTRGLIRYRGGQPLASDWELVDTLSEEHHLLALFADRDHSAPYAARFPDLPSSMNERLTRHTDLQVAIAWPQPTMQLMPDPKAEGRYVAVGDDRAAQPTDVALKRAGSAQLWWSAPAGESADGPEVVGLIWEAVVRAGPGQERASALTAGRGGRDPQASPLAKWLWGACEAFLRERGQTACLTTRRDPAYERDGLRRFLCKRGYESVDDNPKASGPPAKEAVWAKKTLRE